MTKGIRLLIIFTRNPVQGRVKTRLAAVTGDETALKVYRALREHTASAAKASHAQRAVFYSDYLPDKDCFLDGETLAFLQTGKNLGERMLHAFETAFSLPFRHAVLIGTDCPDLHAGLIDQAFSVLERSDAVIGPAKDGGFYLIGLKRSYPDVFLNRTWSHSSVLKETIRRLGESRATFELLPELQDIDTFEDLQQSRYGYPGKHHHTNFQ